jgi:hypothetical protein
MRTPLKYYYYYRSSGEDTPVFDDATNTNGSNQQLWVTAGNSLARGSNDQDTDIGPESNYAATVFEHIQNSGIVDLQTTDLAGSNTGSPWKKAGMDYYKHTGYKMVLSNCAIGGATFAADGDGNNWSSTGDNRALMVTKVNNGLGHVGGGVTKARGCLFECGPNDATGVVDLADIEIAIHDFFDWFETTFPGVPIYVWNIGRIAAGVTARVLEIQGYIRDAVAEHADAHIVLELADYLDYFRTADGIHLTQFGQDLCGAATIQYLRENSLIANSPVDYTIGATAQGVINGFPVALTTDEQKILNDFVVNLSAIAGDAWNDLDVLVCPAFLNASNALHDMKGTTTPVNNGATHIPGTGFSLLGATSSRINTDFIPSANGVNYVQNDAQWIYLMVKNNHPSGVAGVFMGGVGSIANKRVQLGQNTTGGITWRINDNNSSVLGAALALNGVYYRAIRSASNVSSFRENLTSQNQAGTAVSILDAEITIGCRNNNGVLDFPAAHIVGMYGFADATVPGTVVMRACRNMVVSLMVL